MLESQIKSKCRDQLEKWGWLVVHIIQTNKTRRRGYGQQSRQRAAWVFRSGLVLENSLTGKASQPDSNFCGSMKICGKTSGNTCCRVTRMSAATTADGSWSAFRCRADDFSDWRAGNMDTEPASR